MMTGNPTNIFRLPAGGRLRLFWAAGLDEVAAAFAAAEGARLRPVVPSSRLRWQPRDNWHLTLAFLGNVDVARVSAMAARLAPALVVLDPFTATLLPATWFPARTAVRVIALPVEGHAPLLALAGAVAEAARDEGFAVDAHPFRGHVSIARVPRGFRPRDELPPGGGSGALRVDHVALYESRSTPEGVRYVPMLKLPLRAAAR